MVLFKAMHALFMQNFYPRVRKLDGKHPTSLSSFLIGFSVAGTACSQSLIKYASCLILRLRVTKIVSFVAVELLPRPAGSWADSGPDGEHPLLVLLPCVYDMAGCPDIDECGCRTGPEGCKRVLVR